MAEQTDHKRKAPSDRQIIWAAALALFGANGAGLYITTRPPTPSVVVHPITAKEAAGLEARVSALETKCTELKAELQKHKDNPHRRRR